MILVIELLEKALKLLRVFNDNGYDAYIVGGFVRDYVLGKESFDVDVATNATPKQIQSLFSDVKVSNLGYGSVRVIFMKSIFEITTFRMDLEYKDNRKPSKIVYTDNLKIDLKRRDFTINTLCMDYKGNVIDELNVISDIKNKIIKTVGDADKKMEEDSLRILRAIRFSTNLGFKLDDNLVSAIKTYKNNIKELSYFRKKQELNKIFSSSNVLEGIRLLRYFDLDKLLDIDLSCNIEKTSDPIGIWAQVNPSDNYPFTANEKEYLKAISSVLKDKTINDMELYKYGNYVCYIASQILKLDEKDIYDRYDAIPIKKTSDININGAEIIEILKLSDKSKVSFILKDVEEKIILRKLDNNKEDIKKYIINTY